jgi:hypothetical protein
LSVRSLLVAGVQKPAQELSYLEQEYTYADCSAATRSPQS